MRGNVSPVIVARLHWVFHEQIKGLFDGLIVHFIVCLHQNFSLPFKARFIANSCFCTTTELSKYNFLSLMSYDTVRRCMKFQIKIDFGQ